MNKLKFAVVMLTVSATVVAASSNQRQWQIERLIPAAAAAQEALTEVCFSPGTAEACVVKAINGASRSIYLAAYSFTSKPIARALLDAHRRGVKVFAVLDKSQLSERYSGATFLANAGVPVRINARYAIMHNKFMVIDDATVQTGSFNYTSSAATRNAENVLVLRDSPPLGAAYGREWKRLWDEGANLAPRY